MNRHLHPLERRVEACIEREHLCEAGAHILVALSGGADSVALLRALLALGYRVSALHCNFRLRASASDADEAFVHQLCSEHSVALESCRFDTRTYASERGVSIEMAARALRYAWFEEIRLAHLPCYVAVAHNAQDRVETLLLNLAKGTGIRGLSGMPYRRDDGVIRPLMDCMPSEIRAYLASLGQPWREDESNSDERYQRNYIRHTLIPSYGQLNPGFLDNVQRSMTQVQGAELFYHEAIERYRRAILGPSGIHIEGLMASPHPETLLFEILRDYGFSGEQCRAISASLPALPSGRYFESASHRLIRSWGYLEILALDTIQADYCLELPIPPLGATQTYALPRGMLHVSLERADGLAPLALGSSEVAFDWEALPREHREVLVVRSPHQGERMQPMGMSGSKRISRILIDKKIGHERRAEALLVCADHQPLWLLGLCRSEGYRCTPQTKTIMRLVYTD